MKKISLLLGQVLMTGLAIVGCQKTNKPVSGNNNDNNDDTDTGDEVEIVIDGDFSDWDAFTATSEDGTVYVDGKQLDEPYLTEKAYGDCDIELPYQVPDNRYFCMGDHRSTSVDSRSTTVGCVSDEQIVGKIVFRVWPLPYFGALR